MQAAFSCHYTRSTVSGEWVMRQAGLLPAEVAKIRREHKAAHDRGEVGHREWDDWRIVEDAY